MPKARNPNQDKAFEIYKEHNGNITNRAIAELLGEDEKVIAVWKSRNKWNVVQQSEQCCTTKKKGGQPGNKNALGHGAPEQNKNALGYGAPEKNNNAEKHGFFSKYLPEETFSIIQAIEEKNPLDILWENIQLAYAAIIRAQQIMYVKDIEDKTVEKIGEKFGESSEETRWEVQQAWDKQATFLKAQARAQAELRSLIKQYEELLHKNLELVTEEQKARVAYIKAQTDKITGEYKGNSVADDWIESMKEADEEEQDE